MRRLAVSVLLLATACSGGSRRADHAATPRSSTSTAPLITRSEAIARVRRLRAEVSPNAILSAKLVTEEELWSAENLSTVPASQLPPNLTPDRLIWAVMAQGRYTPAFGRGETLRWGVFRVDEHDGSILGTFGSESQAWQGWKLLKDRAKDS